MHETENNKFISGLFAKAPRERAPEFVKGSLSIKREELISWLQQRNDEWVNVDIKVSKAGKWYCQVNDFKPEEKKDGYQDMVKTYGQPTVQPDANGMISTEDIPF